MSTPSTAAIDLDYLKLSIARDEYRDDPTGWVDSRLGEFTWSKQRDVLASVRDNRRTAVHSCHGTGKSWLAARIAAWWIETHRPGDAFVVTSAPTGKQVKAILWREIGRAHAKGRLSGRTNQTEWWGDTVDEDTGKVIGEELVAFGQKPSDFAPDAFQGIHARFVLVIFDEACHDDQTDVMTERGWVRFPDLLDTDHLLTMDPETHVAEYAKPLRVVRKRYHGPMVEYSAKGANYCVTPDHQMYAHSRRGASHRPWKFVEARDLEGKNNHYMRKDVKWIAPDVDEYTIPGLVSERKTFDSITVPMDDWLVFLGWYCSEGHLTLRDAVPYSVGITQKNDAIHEIESLCHKLGFNPKRYDSCGQVCIHSRQLAEHLSELGVGARHKRLPRYVSMCSARQVNLFLDVYVRGDGYQKGKGQVIYTSSKSMADDLQELVLRTGVPSVVRERELPESDFGTHIAHPQGPGYVVTRPHESTQIKSYPDNFSTTDYDGVVYCATLPKHHLLLTRRNGYTLWSGNCGMPTLLWDAADTLLANEESRFLAIGNPDDPTSEFAEVCKPGSGWSVIGIDAFHTPNFTGERIPTYLKHLLIGSTWVEEKREKWKEDSPLYISKVLGKFPDTTEGGLIPLRWVREAQDRDLAPGQPNELGVDVGRGGDKSTIAHRRGPVVRVVSRDQNPDTMQTCGNVISTITKTRASVAKVDEIGIGAGVVDRAKELSKPVTGVNVGSAASCTCPASRKADGHAGECPRSSFINLRAEGFWSLRERFQEGTIDIDPDDDDLAAQLVDLRFKRTSSGKIQVESKDDMRRRGRSSPDDADAVMLAFLSTPTRKKMKPTWGKSRR